MKVLIADKFEASGHEALRRLECQLVSLPECSADQLPAALAEHDPHILIVRSTKVSEAAVLAGRRMELIVRAGAGYDTIDVAAASRDGVFVANCPGKNAVAVAELTWGLITGLDRRLYDQTAELRQGRWNKNEYSKARGLLGRTLGLIGLGTIAREVARRARAFRMPTIAWSRSLTEDGARDAGVLYAATPLEVAQKSDIVSVHVAGTADTRHLVDAAFIAAMRPGAYLINTARGSIMDERAVLDGIAQKGLRVGLDVYPDEPSGGVADFASELAKNPAVLGSHHVGASTDQAQQAIADEAVRIVAHYRATGQVLNCVNLAGRSSATCLLTVRHRNRPGVLATVFQVLSEARINVEEMENVLYQGVEAACARIRLRRAPEPAAIERIRTSCEHILSIELTELPQEATP